MAQYGEPSTASSGDYHLQETSPCIDSGTSQNAPSTDFDGNSRPAGDGWDIGPYEYSGPVSTHSFFESANGIFMYPNPTPNKITISVHDYGLSDLRVYDMLGRDLTKWTRKSMLDETSVVLDLTDLADGIYLVKTEAGLVRVCKE